MRITLIGCGALGSLIGCRLAKAGHDIQVFQRPGATLDRIRTRGIEICDGKTVSSFPVKAEKDPSLLNQANLLIVTVKSFSTDAITSNLLDLLSPEGLVLTVQNGLGNGEKLAAAVGADRVSAGCCTYGAYRDDDGLAHLGGEGDIRFGPMKPGINWQPIEKALSGAGLSVSVVKNSRPEIWSKLMVNAAINPVSALIRQENGHILSCKETESLSRSLTEEACSVAESVEIPLNEEQMWLKVRKIIQLTAKNRSSMLQDILAGRPTEIDAISGEIIRLGHENGLCLPVTETVYSLVKGLEKN